MARRLIRCVVCGLSCLPFLAGCVSTEELYAEYDAKACNVVFERVENGVLTLRETISNSYFPWEPAVYFDYDKARLGDEARSRLDAAAEILNTYPTLLIGLQGFTDRFGSRNYNRGLAERRATRVAAYLQGKGVGAERIVSQPIGEGLPAFGNDDAVARANNRRVELMLLDEMGRPVHPMFDFSGLSDE